MPSVGVLRCSRNPVDARIKNYDRGRISTVWLAPHLKAPQKSHKVSADFPDPIPCLGDGDDTEEEAENGGYVDFDKLVGDHSVGDFFLDFTQNSPLFCPVSRENVRF